MIKVLKIQKGLIVIIIGVFAIVGYALMIMNDMPDSKFVLGFAGVLFILGSLMLLYPILIAKKNKDGIVELDPEIAAEEQEEEESTTA